MLKAKTLKNLALTFGKEKAVDDSLSFKKYYIKVDPVQRNKWILECQKLEAAGMLKPDPNIEDMPEIFMAWHGYLGTEFDRIGVILLSDKVVISYKTKSALDKA